MAVASGLAAQIGYGRETTYGTPVTVDRFLPLLSESIADDYGRIEAADIIAGNVTMMEDQTGAGNNRFAGGVAHYLFNRNIGLLFEAALGNVATVGTGPYTHTVTPGTDFDGEGLTVQVGVPDNAGTVRPFTYSGCKIASLGVSGTPGEFMSMDVDLVAQDVATGTALATASQPASLYRYRMSDLAVTIGGASVCARSFDMTIANAYDVGGCAGTQIIKEPRRNGHTAITGTVELEWTDLTHYTRYQDLTTAALVATFDNGTDTVTITTNARFDGERPNVDGKGVIYQSVDWVAVGSGTDASTITVEVVNSDATA